MSGLGQAKKFHIMRDLPFHAYLPIPSGMWGGTRDAIPNMENLIKLDNVAEKQFNPQSVLHKVWDIAKNSVIQHGSFGCRRFGDGNDAKPFPVNRVNWEAVGISWIDESPSQMEMDELQKTPPPSNCIIKNVLSYSLYGDEKRYTDNVIPNAELVSKIYPGWIIRIYHDNSVPKLLLERLKNYEHVELHNMETSGFENKMIWRFLVASDPSVDRYVIRDIDSRVCLREKAAVDEWIASGKRFHVMRDHPAHSNHPISGGMWGGTHDAVPNMDKLIEHYLFNDGYLQDMLFLGSVIWPIASKSLLQHDAFSCQRWGGGLPFPTKRVNWEVVGEVFIDGVPREADKEILKETEQPVACKTPTVYKNPI